MRNKCLQFLTAISFLTLTSCSSQDVPQAHKGRKFDKTGAAALWSGGHGFEGPILGPGTYYTGLYPEVRMVDCGQRTVKEPLTALTKDGVQFFLDIYVRFSANCDEDKAVEKLLNTLSPANLATAPAPDPKAPQADTKHDVDADPVEPFPTLTITSKQIYATYIRPALGEAVRESVSPYIANDVNGKREEIFEKIKKAFEENLGKKDDKLINIYGLNLSNLDFPDAMDKANAERAAQAILKDKAIAEQEKVKAEIETAKLDIVKQDVEAQATARKINVVGKALHDNPEYYLRDIYYYAGEKGGMIVMPSNPNTILQMTPKK